MSTNNTTDLSLVIAEEQLQPQTRQTLLDSFGPMFEQAKQWREKAEQLVVTDAGQTDLMKQAREARLALKSIRVDADKMRKALKEDSIRKGRAIQGMYNVIEYLIKPLENHLQEQEDFVKIQRENEREALHSLRSSEIMPYEEFVPVNLEWADMSEDEFQKLLKSGKQQQAEKIEAEKRAEQERIAAEKATIEERRRIEEENKRLRAEAAAREAELAKEREQQRKAEEQRQAEERKRQEQEARERAAAEAKAAEDRKAQEAILAEERKQREKAQAELKRRQAEEEARKLAAYEAEQRAKSAPDLEKLDSYLEKLEGLAVPEFESEAGKRIGLTLRSAIDHIVKNHRIDRGALITKASNPTQP